jgi:hypothetical protein
MKWVKFDEDFKKKGPLYKLSQKNDSTIFNYKSWEITEIEAICFHREAGSRISFQKALLNEEDASYESKESAKLYHKWVCHNRLPEAYFDPRYFENDYYKTIGIEKEKYKEVPNDNVTPHPYEIYIGGWLHFYDSEVQCGDSDHAVYFHWDYKCRCVTVYISQLSKDKRWNVNVNVNVNPPGSSDPTKPTIPPPYC